MSLFELIHKYILLKFKCERSYAKTYNTGTADHIAFSLWAATGICLIGTWWIWSLVAYPLAWCYYAPYKELVIDGNSLKGPSAYRTWAQILERSSGFVLGLLPLALVLLKYFLIK